MTKTEAHRVLDAAIAGGPVNELDILIALRATGDMAPMRLCNRAAPSSGRTPPPMTKHPAGYHFPAAHSPL